ncbi:MAG TPA: LysE family transporter [Dictyoglomaceae bacterium]|nr:LysE family transporter [Dictyoglomaceae bacterium]HOL39837.1 LysE family transporter [Dictyoglomaceae bacterium]HPP16315.1 LysE family transporter [Dictyoglomaceae bacterium]HPU43556.1 LysE family transporter [Dictyoglomaceae bacterium]
MGILNLFITSFLIGFSGASAPGPMMTMVLTQSSIGGWKDSIKIVSGHAILEGVFVVLLVFGFQSVLNNPVFIKVFSFFGSLFLLYMGINLFVLVFKKEVEIKNSDPIKVPLPIAGILVSLANPYWLLWWLTVGVNLLAQAKNFLVIGVLSFYVGHILSDFVWYLFVGFIGQGLAFPFWKRVYRIILFAASLFLIFFGFYFLRYVFTAS